MPDKLSQPADYEERRLAAEDLGNCYCVEASAGTGKTTLLTDRYLNLVRAGAAVERIVAITFTEMAAAELKVRIRDRLDEERARCDDPPVLERLTAALLRMEGARISTIHSFASRLLRERPVEAGVDPFFDTMDRIQSDLFFREAWTAWLERHLQKEESAFGLPLTLGASIGSIGDLARRFYENRDLEPAAPPRSPLNAAAVLGELATGINRLASMAKQSCKDTRDKGFELAMTLASAVDSLREQEPEKRLVELLKATPKIEAKSGDKNKWQPGACDEHKELRAELEALRARTAEAIGAAALHELLGELRGFLATVSESKRTRGVLDFQDLLILARDMLRDNLPVRRYFQKQFDHLLVDEFQDTDPLQAEIIYFLAEAEPRAATWTDVKLRPGKLFIVGDPKQSIYRFRRADIEIYERAKTIIEAQGASATIYQNWRSQVPIIDWVNHVCGRMIRPSEDGYYQPDYMPLAPAPGALVDGGATVLLLPTGDERSATVSEARAAEAECTATAIRCMLDEGWPVRDCEDGAQRPVRAGDIALLFPATTEIETFEQALQKERIGYQFEGGKRFHQRREVRDLAVLLGALDNPEDELLVVGALQSLFFGISNAELAEFREAGGRFNYLKSGVRPPAMMGEAFKLMARLHGVRHGQSLASLITAVLEETQVREFLMFLPRGEQAVMNLDKIASMARYLESTNQVTLRGFTRWLAEMEAGRAEDPEMVSDESEGAVHILTIHKAKGLEFPVVILANLGSGSSGSENLVADRVGGRFFTKLSRDKDFPIYSSGWEEAKAEEGLRKEAERQRLFYVAATRARDYLLVPLFAADRSQGYTKDLLGMREGFSALAESGYLREMSMVGLARPAREALVAGEALDSDLPSRQGCLNRLETLKNARISRYRRETPSAEKEGPEDAVASFKGSGLKLGSALHALMERVPLDGAGEVEELATRLTLAAGIGDKADRLAELGRNCLASTVLKRAARAARALREVPFTLLDGDRLVEGRIDLLFEEDGALVLVDYKTDSVSERDLAQRVESYHHQGELYAEAAAAVTGLPVKEVIFLFAALPAEVSLPGAELI